MDPVENVLQRYLYETERFPRPDLTRERHMETQCVDLGLEGGPSPR